ncbi:hypothetical protein WR25_24556 [Diploscapter pachys]|uniref:Transposase n=1 Tax=Diploscapter pachys TaxID=2018661 RepID=A0A2A2KFX5_9BILA|nr:hypothetical protein WR25_24556 [Diploscapter pachys]
MRRKQFSEEQIIGILKEAQAGAVVMELCRKHGKSSATYYAWKAKFGGMAPANSRTGYSSQTWVHTTDARLSGKVYPARSIIAGRLPAHAMSASGRHPPKAGPQNGHSQGGSMFPLLPFVHLKRDRQRIQLAASEVIDDVSQLGNTATYRVVSVRHHDSLDGC